MGIDGKNESRRSRRQREGERGNDEGAMWTSLSITKNLNININKNANCRYGKRKYRDSMREGVGRSGRTTCHMLFAFVKQTHKWMLVVKICWLFKSEKWVASCSRWTLFVSSAPACEEVFDPQSFAIPAIHSVEGYSKFVHTENLWKS